MSDIAQNQQQHPSLLAPTTFVCLALIFGSAMLAGACSNAEGSPELQQITTGFDPDTQTLNLSDISANLNRPTDVLDNPEDAGRVVDVDGAAAMDVELGPTDDTLLGEEDTAMDAVALDAMEDAAQGESSDVMPPEDGIAEDGQTQDVLSQDDVLLDAIVTPEDTTILPPDDSEESDITEDDATTPEPECIMDEDCPVDLPSGPCLTMVCLEGQCIFTPVSDDTSCDDSDPCKLETTCLAGTCQGGSINSCDDDNACTLDLCDPISGCTHVTLTCNDFDPCTFDGCDPATGCVAKDKICPDPIAQCRVGACVPETGDCTVVDDTQGAACNDNDPCTEGDSCGIGVCESGPNMCECESDSDCSANDNPCAGDSTCDLKTHTCVADPTTALACQGVLDVCKAEICDSTVGECVIKFAQDGTSCPAGACMGPGQCQQGVCEGEPIVCDDGIPCTADFCDEANGGCSTENLTGEFCDDGNGCTHNDLCVEGICTPGMNICECLVDVDCHGEFNACQGTPFCDTTTHTCEVDPTTAPVCAGPINDCQQEVCEESTGECVVIDDDVGKTCLDAGPCTQPGACFQGECMAFPVICEQDQNVCTVNACNEANNLCQIQPSDVVPCDDGDPCTLIDLCQQGICVGDEADTCDDDSLCTNDSCVSGQGCVNADISGTCNDNNLCTIDTCDPVEGCVNELVVCPTLSTESCETTVCEKELGCVVIDLPEGDVCDDSNPCTTDDMCVMGECIGHDIRCVDGADCQEGNCVEGECIYTSVTEGDCDDGDPCTFDDSCGGDGCQGTALVCEETDECHKDKCWEGDCVSEPLTGTDCDDDDPCTEDESCNGGVCEGVDLVCTNDNPCAESSCVDGDCVPENLTGPHCEDDDPCTYDELCQEGVCVVMHVDCADENPCTDDSCVGGDCPHTPVSESKCELEVPCYKPEGYCEDGLCKGYELECDDLDECTTDFCFEGGCKFEEIEGCGLDEECFGVPPGTPCDDGDGDTWGDLCLLKKCRGFRPHQPFSADDDPYIVSSVDYFDGHWFAVGQSNPNSDSVQTSILNIDDPSNATAYEGTVQGGIMRDLYGGYGVDSDGDLWRYDDSVWSAENDVNQKLDASDDTSLYGVYSHETDTRVFIWAIGQVGSNQEFIRRCVIKKNDNNKVSCKDHELEDGDPPSLPRNIAGMPHNDTSTDVFMILTADGTNGVQNFNDTYENQDGKEEDWESGFWDTGPSQMVSRDIVIYGDREALVVGDNSFMRHRTADDEWHWSFSLEEYDFVTHQYQGLWAHDEMLAMVGHYDGFGASRKMMLWTCPIDENIENEDNWQPHELQDALMLTDAPGLYDIHGLPDGTMVIVGGWRAPFDVLGKTTGIIYVREP